MFSSNRPNSNKRPNRPGRPSSNKNGNKNSNKNGNKNGGSAWSPGVSTTGSGASSWSPAGSTTGSNTGSGASSWSPSGTGSTNTGASAWSPGTTATGSGASSWSPGTGSTNTGSGASSWSPGTGSTNTGSGASSWSPSGTTTGGTTVTLSDAYGPNTSGYSGFGCNDVNECAACSAGSKYGSACPCSDPTPICMNIPGGYTCGAGTAYGDPHFRVSAPGLRNLSNGKRLRNNF